MRLLELLTLVVFMYNRASYFKNTTILQVVLSGICDHFTL